MDENDVIVGADALGLHAGEWIQFFTLAIKQELSIQALAETIFIIQLFRRSSKRESPRYIASKILIRIIFVGHRFKLLSR
jgi:hypothetical protein